MIRYILARIIAFILVLILAFTLLLTSELGLKLTALLAEFALHGHLRIETIHGTALSNTLEIKKLYFENHRFAFTADNIRLTWRPKSLFEGQLIVDNLQSDHLVVKISPLHDRNPFLLPWPKKITLHKSDITHFDLYVKNDKILNATHAVFTGYIANNPAIPMPQEPVYFDLQSQWTDLAVQSLESPKFLSQNGHLFFRGYLDRYMLNVSTPLQYGVLKGTSEIVAHGGHHFLEFNSIIINTLNGISKGNAAIHWEPGFSWAVNLSSEKLHPETIWPKFPGNISFEFLNKGHLLSHQLYTQLSFNNIQGNIQNRLLHGNLGLEISPGQTKIIPSALTLGKIHASLNGGFNKQWNVNFNLFMPEPIPLAPKISLLLNSHGTITGPRHNPILQTTITPSLHAPGNGIQNIAIETHTDKTGLTHITGHAKTLTGLLNLEGTAGLRQAGIPFALKLHGNNARLIQTKEYQLNVSPQLKINSQEGHVVVEGSILVPSAMIMIKNPERNSTSLSNDIVLNHDHQSSNPFKQTHLDVSGNVHITTGNNVRLNIAGLSGRLAGELAVRISPETPMTAFGNLDMLDAKYEAYGQRLKVREGKIAFTGGPIDDPGVTLRAVRTVYVSQAPTFQTGSLPSASSLPMPASYSSTLNNEVVVGISVTGTVKNHQIRLFSEPAAYSSSDILSLLLFGQLSGDISLANAQAILQTANSLDLGGNQLLSITQQLQSSFGLDELGFRSETLSGADNSLVQTTSFFLGKQLTRRLHVSYSIGLLNPISIFRIRYLLNNNWSIQSENTTLSNGVDLFYSVEKEHLFSSSKNANKPSQDIKYH